MPEWTYDNIGHGGQINNSTLYVKQNHSCTQIFIIIIFQIRFFVFLQKGNPSRHCCLIFDKQLRQLKSSIATSVFHLLPHFHSIKTQLFKQKRLRADRQSSQKERNRQKSVEMKSVANRILHLSGRFNSDSARYNPRFPQRVSGGLRGKILFRPFSLCC